MSRHAVRTQAISRREFTLEAALAMLAGVTITISGCGSDNRSTPASPTSTPTTSTPGGDVNGTVSANHGHVATITGAQITAAGALSLNIRGSATHPHTVTLSADEIRQVGARQQVTKASSTDDGHSHNITFN